MKKYSDMLAKYANGWLILALFVAESAFMGFILPAIQKQLLSGGGEPLDLMFFPSPERIFSILAGFDAQALLLYRNVELSVDILYPVTYTLFYSLLITFLLQRALEKGNPLQLLNLLPFGAFVFDLLENASILSLIAVQPAQPVELAVFLMFVNGIKWLFAGTSIIALIFALSVLAVKKFRRQ